MSHAMTDIPEDAWSEAKAIARKAVWADGRGMIGRERNYLEDRVARAILADRAAQAERMARLEEAARDVVWFDWSDNDDDAVAAIERLRAALRAKEQETRG